MGSGLQGSKAYPSLSWDHTSLSLAPPSLCRL
jgi:hypothetical protein